MSMEIVLISGMSGSGKSVALHALEDAGYYCVDNLPPVLIVRFADLCWKSTSSTRHVAVVTDIRGGSFFEALPQALDELEKRGIPHEVVFLEASDEALVRRYMETRRQHPLAKNMRIQEGIEQERKILAGVRAQADMIIDTTSMQASDLKEYMQSRFSADSTDQEMQITVFSFGFKYGIPIDADMVIDVRFLPNPFYIDELKYLTGNDRGVQDYVMSFPEAGIFLDKLTDLLRFLIPNYIKEGKYQLVVAIGCTGGKHRSVTLANELYRKLRNREAKYGVSLSHRDI